MSEEDQCQLDRSGGTGGLVWEPAKVRKKERASHSDRIGWVIGSVSGHKTRSLSVINEIE